MSRFPKWHIVGHHPKPSQAEARQAVKEQIEILGRSHRERDGVVRDPEAISDITKLQRAAELLKRSNLKEV